MSTAKSLTSQLADALLAGDQDAVISIMAQVIAYIANDESDDDAELAKTAFTDAPWSTPESNLDANAFCSVCLIDDNAPGAEKVKSKCHLPVRSSPGAPVNKNALRNAAARLNQTKSPSTASAKKRLVALMHAAGIDTSLAKAFWDEGSATPSSSLLLPYLLLKAYAAEHAARQADPASFDTIRRKELTPGVVALIGFNGDKSEIESLRFDADKFTEEEARKWLTDHNFSTAKFEAASKVEKIGPGINSVHVPTTEVSDKLATEVCDICGKLPCECTVDVYKSDDERRLAYGVVYKPDVTDSQGDQMSAAEIEKMAHAYMLKSREFDLQHILDLEPSRAQIVESYIVPADTILDNGVILKRGSWVAVTYFSDPELWSLVKSGAVRAYSIRGYGTRIPL